MAQISVCKELWVLYGARLVELYLIARSYREKRRARQAFLEN